MYGALSMFCIICGFSCICCSSDCIPGDEKSSPPLSPPPPLPAEEEDDEVVVVVPVAPEEVVDAPDPPAPHGLGMGAAFSPLLP